MRNGSFIRKFESINNENKHLVRLRQSSFAGNVRHRWYDNDHCDIHWVMQLDVDGNLRRFLDKSSEHSRYQPAQTVRHSNFPIQAEQRTFNVDKIRSEQLSSCIRVFGVAIAFSRRHLRSSSRSDPKHSFVAWKFRLRVEPAHSVHYPSSSRPTMVEIFRHSKTSIRTVPECPPVERRPLWTVCRWWPLSDSSGWLYAWIAVECISCRSTNRSRHSKMDRRDCSRCNRQSRRRRIAFRPQDSHQFRSTLLSHRREPHLPGKWGRNHVYGG